MRLVSCQFRPACRPVCRPETLDLRFHGSRVSSRICCVGTAQLHVPFHGGRNKNYSRLTSRAGDGVAAKADSADHPLLLETPLGIDFGRARIGLATCPGGFLSAPLKILDSRRRLWLELAEEIIEIAQQQGVDGFVVGLPVTSRGNIRRHETDSMQGRACRNFAQILHATARPHALPVFLFDERMTSSDAAAALGLEGTSRLKQKGKLDAVAAAMLLTAYFERPEGAIKVKSIMLR